MQTRIESILDEAASPVAITEILSSLSDIESRPVDCQAVEEALRASPLIAEVERGLWVRAASIINQRTFFAIPEAGDVRDGRVCFVGSDLFLLMRLAAKNGHAVLIPETDVEFEADFIIEDTGYFYLAGLEDWYRRSHFLPEKDSIIMTCLDYEAGRYGVRKLSEEELDVFVGARMRTTACNWLALTAKRDPQRFPGSLPNGFSISGALRFLLHDRPAFFQTFPCNLSFFLSLDERFLVTGNQFVLRSESPVDDYTEYYIGRETGLLFQPQDIAKFNRALESLFEMGDALRARELFVQLAGDYPQETLLHKYIYQAAWQLEDYEAVSRHASIYHEGFPRDPDALCTLAEIALVDGQYETAKRLLVKAESLVHPADTSMLADVLIVRMRLLWENNEDDEAARIAERLIEIEPENDEALGLLGDHSARPARGKSAKPDLIRADFSRKKTTETGKEDE